MVKIQLEIYVAVDAFIYFCLKLIMHRLKRKKVKMFWSLMFHFVFSPSVILVKVSSDMVDYKFNIRYKA